MRKTDFAKVLSSATAATTTPSRTRRVCKRYLQKSTFLSYVLQKIAEGHHTHEAGLRTGLDCGSELGPATRRAQGIGMPAHFPGKGFRSAAPAQRTPALVRSAQGRRYAGGVEAGPPAAVDPRAVGEH